MCFSEGRKVFGSFLRGEYSEENILFWLACEDLKKERSPELIEEKARIIYEDYVSILSPREVGPKFFLDVFSSLENNIASRIYRLQMRIDKLEGWSRGSFELSKAFPAFFWLTHVFEMHSNFLRGWVC